MLTHVRHVHYQIVDELVPDFLVGQTAAALFISLRYHLQKPNYIHNRMRSLQRAFRLRVVLCLVDTEDVERGLRELNHACVMNTFTLLCAWSQKEAARYLETLKAYEHKPADIIQERVEQDFMSQMTNCITAVQGLNRMDASALGSRFGSLANVLQAPHSSLSTTPGIGPTKALRLHHAFHEPFIQKRTASSGLQNNQDTSTAGSNNTNPIAQEDPIGDDDYE